MGDRYVFPVTCPICKFKEKEVYYAPTCDITTWECPNCSYILDLENYSGISYKQASNSDYFDSLFDNLDVDNFVELREFLSEHITRLNQIRALVDDYINSPTTETKIQIQMHVNELEDFVENS